MLPTALLSHYFSYSLPCTVVHLGISSGRRLYVRASKAKKFTDHRPFTVISLTRKANFQAASTTLSEK